MSDTNINHKDRVFNLIFGREENKSWTLSLYNAVNNSDFTNYDDIQIETIENYLYMSIKNDVAFVIGDYINLYEHQSTYNPNMPLREMIYLSRLYEKIIKKNKMNIYSEKQLILPAPRFIFFYNGKQEIEDKVLRLKDAFPENVRDKSDIDISVKMLNINYGHNKDLMDKCDALKQYSLFISRIRKYSETFGIDEAINKSIDDMPDGRLKSYFEWHRAEVLQMLFTEYDEKDYIDAIRKESKDEGHEEGLEEGRAEGIENINKLNSLLIKDNRMVDLKKSTEDKEYQKVLLAEYNIC